MIAGKELSKRKQKESRQRQSIVFQVERQRAESRRPRCRMQRENKRDKTVRCFCFTIPSITCCGPLLLPDALPAKQSSSRRGKMIMTGAAVPSSSSSPPTPCEHLHRHFPFSLIPCSLEFLSPALASRLLLPHLRRLTIAPPPLSSSAGGYTAFVLLGNRSEHRGRTADRGESHH